MADTGALGRDGERAAERFLSRRGLKILARNYRCRVGEIDLVALDGDCLVFVEVRRRRHRGYATALESVDVRKQARLTAAAGLYLATVSRSDPACRFDVVGLTPTGNGPLEIEWCRDAFRPD